MVIYGSSWVNSLPSSPQGCPVCGASLGVAPQTFPYLNAGPHKHPTFEGLQMRACDTCGSSWADPAPSTQALTSYYSKAYTPARMGYVERDIWPIWDSRHASLIVLARLLTTFHEGDFFVDVGPGNGASLSMAPLLLPKPRVGCIELNERSLRFFRKHMPDLEAHASLEDFISRFGRSSVKLILSAHSLEHFAPDAVIEELELIHSALCPGGALALEVPYSPVEKTSLVRRHTPHLVFFSDEGVRALLARAGFDVRLCYRAVGRTKWGQQYMAEHFAAPRSYGGLAPDILHKLSAFNVGDLVASDAPAEAAAGVVIKCIAVKR